MAVSLDVAKKTSIGSRGHEDTNVDRDPPRPRPSLPFPPSSSVATSTMRHAPSSISNRLRTRNLIFTLSDRWLDSSWILQRLDEEPGEEVCASISSNGSSFLIGPLQHGVCTNCINHKIQLHALFTQISVGFLPAELSARYMAERLASSHLVSLGSAPGLPAMCCSRYARHASHNLRRKPNPGF
ncbi:hypothetical protein ARMSODRAFT_42775 [Armillaria solidipes]|uniref:Uncharacterized protein n=1 Tax=Armillaria solidipes TaxID=1076256 RepID=A0A2H3CNY4_9AGAR|nr:hypothetical protein ARMSODRAFT_42775 [Armillaria solidipes]